MSPLPNTSGPKQAGMSTKEVKPLVAATAPPEGFREVVQQPLRGWDTPGQETAGYFIGIRPSNKFVGRELVDLVDDDGIVTTWGCPVLLKQALLGVIVRTEVMIRYLGEEKTSKGETKHFQVFLGALPK